MRRFLVGCLAVVGGLVVVVVLAAVIIGALGSRGTASSPTAPTAAAAASTPAPTPTPRGLHQVRYVITVQPDSVHHSVTYLNAQGGTGQLTDVAGSWQQTLSAKDGTALSLVAQLLADDPNATITCTIQVDGQDWKTSRSSGPYATCTASGLLGLN